jgi:ribosomal protein S18 acetylase RimI-like enzyme
MAARESSDIDRVEGGPVRIRVLERDDPARAWIEERWGGSIMVVHGRRLDLRDLPGLVAEDDGAVVGALTYELRGHEAEVVSVDADPPGRGTGRALVAQFLEEARRRGVGVVRATTTNDNLTALGFWQALGFRLVALRPGAVAAARRVKPSIPLVGDRGVPVRDELDLALTLDG